MKHASREQPTKRQQQIKLLKVLSVLLVLALAGTAIAVYRDYQARPGRLEKVWISERGADFLKVSWKKVRNVSKYVVMYDGKTRVFSGRKSSGVIEGLKENTYYEISVRADSEERKGFEAVTASAKTKKAAHITGEDVQTKFANRPSDLKQTAETRVTYEPGDGYTVTPEGKIVFSRSGEVTVTATTEETEEYASASKDITVNVLDSVYVDTNGAAPHYFFELNMDNCELVMTVDGDKRAKYPQSFVYYNGEYIIAFIRKEYQKIITAGSNRNVYDTEEDIGHANGMTIADGRCYTVRGEGSTRCVTFDPPSSNYDSFDLAYGASGIAYDTVTGMFFTSSRSGLLSYDKAFNAVNNLRPIIRKSSYSVQDCGAYNGILMHCVSGEDPQGINYIDFYDMENKKYLGSIECCLNEVESLIVDEEGFIELVCISDELGNCIWKTPINMKKICE